MMTIVKRLLIGTAVMMGLVVANVHADVAAQVLTLAAKGTAAPSVYVSTDDPAVVRAATRWEKFFKARGHKPIALAPDAKSEFANKGALLAFETGTACPLAKQIGLDLSKLKDARPEAFFLVARVWKDRPLVLIVGKSAEGADAGAALLLSKVRCVVSSDGTNWIVTCPTFESFRQPFFRGREATLCPTGRILDPGSKINYENWDKSHLQRYPAYLKACGFNSVQLMELDTYRGGARREKVAPVLYTLADAAHAQGMTVSQYIWGSSDGYHWADPKTRPQKEKRYRELAKAYGKYVDHIITHWKDEGDEGGFQTPLEATVFLYREYQKYNPQVRVTCDAWFNPDIYSGIDNEKIAPRGVGIAIERWYDAARAEQIARAGRKVGIWGWYLSDFEMIYGSHLYPRTLDHYFSQLPPRAGEVVDWISLEMCFHTLPSEINLYVTGQKMWDPKRPLTEILLDYCGAVYGEAHAEIMRQAFETVEAGQKEVRYGMVANDQYPVVLGTPAFKAKVDKVLAAMERVKLPAGWQPNFPVVGTPQDDIDSLRASLRSYAEVNVKKAGPKEAAKP